MKIIYLTIAVSILILLYIYGFYNRDQIPITTITPITTIITTSCRKSTPDTSIIIQNIKHMNTYCPWLTKNIIIVFDGSEIKIPIFMKKCKGKCDAIKIKHILIYQER